MRPTAPNTPAIVKTLEAAALAGNEAGSTWLQFYGANWNRGLVQAARHDPGGYSRLADKLLALLVSGDTGGRLAVGDSEDQPHVAVVPARVHCGPEQANHVQGNSDRRRWIAANRTANGRRLTP